MTIDDGAATIAAPAAGAFTRRAPAIRRAPAALAIGCLLVAALVLGELAGGSGPRLPAAASRAERVSRRPSNAALPPALQTVASNVIGSSDASLWVERHRGLLSASGGGLATTFAGSGISVRAGAGLLELDLVGVGHGRHVAAVAGAVPHASRSSVVYRRGPVLEWYRSGPYGLEQGFTVYRRPAAAGRLTIALRVRGSLSPRKSGSQMLFATASGGVALRYGNLSAVDAGGRTLPVQLLLAGDRLELQIDDRGARYPLRIDPFIQQGAKLVPDDESTRGGSFGFSVALSGDGNTALIGGPEDAEGVGAAWVFTRSGTTWTQQGPELRASGESGRSGFGGAVALSANGTTALIGSPDEGLGSAWVFTRSGSTWTQQGPKLTGAEQVESYGQFGASVSLSGDGDTALIGGSGDHNLTGAAWVFRRTGSTWAQQGPKLVASGESGRAQFGLSVSLSEDGLTALIGGPGNVAGDVDGVGAAWVFRRAGSSWSQQAELTGAGESGGALLGWSVSIAGDGDTALIGGPDDASDIGAAWVFTRSGTSWSQQGSKLTGSGTNPAQQFGWSVAIAAGAETALIGGPYEGSDSFVGAAWVFTRTGTGWSQQGPKLTGAGEVGGGYFGQSVALSGDGDTALVGGSYDNHFEGAAWAFARTESTWSQQGAKLTGSGETGTGNSRFGASAAISASGTTALIGGSDDNEGHGAAWVFTRSGSTWSQQAKLTGSTETGPSAFGSSVAVSANGSTALVGGPYNGDGIGAAWVFKRNGTTWKQQGAKLVASGLNGFIDFGSSVALSSSGDIALIGAPGHEAPAGSAWVFTRSDSTWTQQAKITGSGEAGHSEFGEAVAISSNGGTVLVGGPGDNANTGAAWAFTGSGSTWTQQGPKLTATGEIAAGGFGDGVALSSNGSTALIGGPGDNGDDGAAWVFTRSGSTWTQQGPKLTGAGESGHGLFGHSVAVSGNGNTALVGGWQDDEGVGAAWAFTRSKSKWSPLGAKLRPSDESGAGAFGESVALSSNGLAGLIGGPGDDANVGAAWDFESSGE
jgi:hypothetical protein